MVHNLLSFLRLSYNVHLLIFFFNHKQVHHRFELMEETLFLTVNLIDRFLERQTVIRKKLQLVGVTAMLLACKYEEVSVPVIEDFIVITDKAYTKKDVLDMVSKINLLKYLLLQSPVLFNELCNRRYRGRRKKARKFRTLAIEE